MVATNQPTPVIESELAEIEKRLTKAQLAGIDALIDKRREWLRGVRDCRWCGQRSVDINDHPCFLAEETAIAVTNTALREQLAENARRHFDDARTLERQRDEAQSRLAQVEKERSMLEQAIVICRSCELCAPLIATALKEKP